MDEVHAATIQKYMLDNGLHAAVDLLMLMPKAQPCVAGASSTATQLLAWRRGPSPFLSPVHQTCATHPFILAEQRFSMDLFISSSTNIHDSRRFLQFGNDDKLGHEEDIPREVDAAGAELRRSKTCGQHVDGTKLRFNRRSKMLAVLGVPTRQQLQAARAEPVLSPSLCQNRAWEQGDMQHATAPQRGNGTAPLSRFARQEDPLRRTRASLRGTSNKPALLFGHVHGLDSDKCFETVPAVPGRVHGNGGRPPPGHATVPTARIICMAAQSSMDFSARAPVPAGPDQDIDTAEQHFGDWWEMVAPWLGVSLWVCQQLPSRGPAFETEAMSTLMHHPDELQKRYGIYGGLLVAKQAAMRIRHSEHAHALAQPVGGDAWPQPEASGAGTSSSSMSKPPGMQPQVLQVLKEVVCSMQAAQRGNSMLPGMPSGSRALVADARACTCLGSSQVTSQAVLPAKAVCLQARMRQVREKLQMQSATRVDVLQHSAQHCVPRAATPGHPAQAGERVWQGLMEDTKAPCQLALLKLRCRAASLQRTETSPARLGCCASAQTCHTSAQRASLDCPAALPTRASEVHSMRDESPRYGAVLRSLGYADGSHAQGLFECDDGWGDEEECAAREATLQFLYQQTFESDSFLGGRRRRASATSSYVQSPSAHRSSPHAAFHAQRRSILGEDE
mmetsp:Transcript_31211/g.93118  ORF Transcript_31211/g.93118 Transcript_31211/m.93118 type:complete len:675 (-) Transcript_31211:1212-3236(-)